MQSISSWDFAAAGVGAWQRTGDGSIMSAIATVAGSGSVAFGVLIEVSNNPNDVNGSISLFTLSASGTDGSNDSKSDMANWPWARARCTSLTGTGAKGSVSLSSGG